MERLHAVPCVVECLSTKEKCVVIGVFCGIMIEGDKLFLNAGYYFRLDVQKKKKICAMVTVQ